MPKKPLKFFYRNWRGKCGYRTVEEPVMWYGSTQYHKNSQWFIRGYDLDKQNFRDFAVNDIIEFVREV